MGSSCSRIFYQSDRTSHDVFISFGGDTRYKFTSHLRGAFIRRRIKTYVDFNLERGNEISSTLVLAIRRAKVSVIVFSENTAASKWCMDEIAEIIECKRTREQIVVPIFYHVDPSHVRRQSGSYDAAFSDHMKNPETSEKVSRWRDALREAANLSGWECLDKRFEYELVERIAKDVKTKLDCYQQQINKTGDDFERIKIKLHKLYKNNGLTVVQVLHVWEMKKAENLMK